MNAPLRKARPYLFYGQTTSLCDICHALVPAKICIAGDEVYYEKRCRTHGLRKALISTDAKFYRWQREFLKAGDKPLKFQNPTEFGCPYDCGLCPDHEQHSCLALIEINEVCNLTCPVCFADSSPQRTRHLPLATIDGMLDAIVASEGEPDLVQLSGGEPTLHPQFFEILALARSKPIRHVMINTNGLRIAQEPDFVARLAEHRRGLEVYLQFDSLERDALMAIRGADLRRVRQQALENLERHNISTTLVCVVKKGVNDREMGAIVNHALDWRCVRGVTFQPVQDAGRNENFDPIRDRALLSDIRRRIVEDSGVFGERDMIPLPCNPSAITIGYGVRNGRNVAPVTSFVSHEDLLSEMPNTVSFEKYPELRKRVFDLFSLSTGPETAADRVAALLCCLPSAPVPEGLTYDNIFRVTVIEFLDAHNFCLANVKRSCVHFVTPVGQIIPFDTYNLFYRNGRIDGIRARMRAEAGGSR
ncbi:MAG: radical SAM protein [Roseiarcus sp.]|jgi:tetraether lipid synthase